MNGLKAANIVNIVLFHNSSLLIQVRKNYEVPFVKLISARYSPPREFDFL